MFICTYRCVCIYIYIYIYIALANMMLVKLLLASTQREPLVKHYFSNTTCRTLLV